jgi:hypothetical protein
MANDGWETRDATIALVCEQGCLSGYKVARQGEMRCCPDGRWRTLTSRSRAAAIAVACAPPPEPNDEGLPLQRVRLRDEGDDRYQARCGRNAAAACRRAGVDPGSKAIAVRDACEEPWLARMHCVSSPAHAACSLPCRSLLRRRCVRSGQGRRPCRGHHARRRCFRPDCSGNREASCPSAA